MQSFWKRGILLHCFCRDKWSVLSFPFPFKFSLSRLIHLVYGRKMSRLLEFHLFICKTPQIYRSNRRVKVVCLRVWSLLSLVATSQPPSVKVLSPGSLTTTLALFLPAGMIFMVHIIRLSMVEPWKLHPRMTM